MHKPESVQENETHKILWGFKIPADHLIPTRRQDLGLINKNKTCHHRLCHSSEPQIEKKRWRKVR